MIFLADRKHLLGSIDDSDKDDRQTIPPTQIPVNMDPPPAYYLHHQLRHHHDQLMYHQVVSSGVFLKSERNISFNIYDQNYNDNYLYVLVFSFSCHCRCIICRSFFSKSLGLITSLQLWYKCLEKDLQAKFQRSHQQAQLSQPSSIRWQ